jgi:hypothetical protein
VTVVSTLTPTTPFIVTSFGYVLARAGFGLLVPGITHVAMRDVAAPVAGAASAVLNSSRQLGTAVGLALVGAVGAATTHHTWTKSSYGQSHTADPIASGDLRSLPPPMQAAARHAFETGYHAALALCVAALLTATWLSLHAFKERPAPARTAREEPSL